MKTEQIFENFTALKADLAYILTERKLFSIKQGVTIFMLFFAFLIALFCATYTIFGWYDSAAISFICLIATFYLMLSKYKSTNYARTMVGWFCIFIMGLSIVLTLLFGWRSGGAVFVITMMSFNYFLSLNNKSKVALMAAAEIILFVPFFYFCLNYLPFGFYNPSQDFIATIFLLVCFSNFSGLLLCVFLYSHIVSNSIKRLENENEELANRAKYDYLTGLINRRSIEELIAIENLQKRGVNSFALIIGDVDHFKQINDTYTHQCGDLVLKKVAKSLLKTFRDSDLVCRWGGEEFMVFCENVTFEHAHILLERTRKNILAQRVVYEDEPVQVSITFGAVFCDDLSKYNKTELIKQADNLLYEGKRMGRNMVILKRAAL